MTIPHESRCKTLNKILVNRGTWATQWVKHPTLGFCSGHDFTVHEFEPHVGLCAGSAEPGWDCLSPSLSAPLLLTHSLTQKNKQTFKKKY